MTFSGKIEDLSPFDILQYLHAGKKSGRLKLTRKDETASVYLQEGKILHALSPQRTDLGELLIQNKEMTPQTFQKARLLQKGQHKEKPIGSILVEIGAITPLRLKQALFQQTEKMICHLVTWAEGEFTFDPDETIPVEEIDFNPTTLLPMSSIDTSRLLSQAFRLLNQEKGRSKSPYPSLESRDLGLPGGKDSSTEETGQALPNRPAEKILLMTDDGIFRNLLRSELLEKGMEVTAPATLEECLSKCEASMSDGLASFILVEERLSGDSRRRGAAMRILAEKERSLSRFTVLVLSDEVDPESILEIYSGGALAVLPKPTRDGSKGARYTEAVKKLSQVVWMIVQQFCEQAAFQPPGEACRSEWNKPSLSVPSSGKA